MGDQTERSPLLADFRRAVRAKIEDDLAAEAASAEATRSRVMRRLTLAVQQTRARGALGRAWLFGSFADGQPGTDSDVDLLIEGPYDPDRVAGRLAAAVHRPVHVVPMSAAPPTLVQRAMNDGVEI